MASAKEIVIKPITSAKAKAVVAANHYSGKSTQNSQIHLGVFLNDACEGVLQFGPPIDRRKILGLVKNTLWNEMLELNRMAFSERLPKNSESRALAVSMRILKKHYPHLKWVVSFADGAQCGDGTIYRASGFFLTAIKKNKTMLLMPDGSIVADKTLNDHPVKTSGWWKKNGAKPLEGYQLRYVYFLQKDQLCNLTVPTIPFNKIDEIGAGMYKGESISIEARRQK